MQKPFDAADLVARLKAKGLVDAEKAVNDVVADTMDWLGESFKAQGGLQGTIGSFVISEAKPMVMDGLAALEAKL